MLAMVLLLAGCPSDDPGGSATTTGVLTITATTGPNDGTTTAPTSGMDSTAATSMGPTTAGETEASDGPPGIFDLSPFPDFGGPMPPVMPTCDNLDMLGPTSIGCEFWATAVPTSGGFGLGWGVSVGNPFEDLDVTVTIEDQRGPGGTLRMFHQFVLGPRESQIINMNGSVGGVIPNENHTAPSAGLGSNVGFRITSDSPVTAMQINPIGGAPSFVPDASMLLPINSLGQAYYGMGYGGGWVIVVATEDGTTLNTDAGVQVLDAFDTYTFTPASDPTGFFVGSDRPVAVFSGSSCVTARA